MSLKDLVDAITSTKNLSEIKGYLDTEGEARKRKRKTLNKPLHRQARERVESNFAYKESRKELRVWDPIVQENRAAEQLFFPLNDPTTFYGTTATDKAKSFTPRTEFEKKLFEALGENKTGTDAEADQELTNAMNLKEIKKRKLKLQKMRALASYTAAKNARQSKIKSKTFHRVRKRDKKKKLIKEVEDLLAKDPEAAKEKLKELDKDRAYERATLKHRGTGKWSVQLRQYASKNPGMQKLMTEHLQLGRELKARHGLENALRDESESDEEPVQKPLTKSEMLELAVDQARRELESEQDLSKVKIKKASENPEILENLRFIRQKDNEKEESTEVKLADVDTVIAVNPDDEDDEGDGFLVQAFNADDVVGEFANEKERLEEESKPKAIDNRLFGWGSWTGPGISDEDQMKKKERFLTKAQPKIRKDKGKKRVIIREELAQQGLAKIQPKDVPFPFTAVKDFEAVIRQPIGRDWNTNIAHKNLTKKAINTKAGRIINPMSKDDELLKTLGAIFDKDSDDDLL